MTNTNVPPAEREGEIRKQHVYFAGGKNSPGFAFDDYHEAAHFIRCNSWLVEPYIEMLPALHPAPASGKLGEYEQIGYIQKFLPPYGDDPNMRYFGYDAQYDRITKYTAQSNATDNPAKTEVVPVFALRATATPRKEEE